MSVNSASLLFLVSLRAVLDAGGGAGFQVPTLAMVQRLFLVVLSSVLDSSSNGFCTPLTVSSASEWELSIGRAWGVIDLGDVVVHELHVRALGIIDGELWSTPSICSRVGWGRRSTEDVEIESSVAMAQASGDEIRSLHNEVMHFKEPRAGLGYLCCGMDEEL
ncbi:hypothetical protein B0H10DRAFT_1376178 [Mycena sp. CBHHK59/15]|nr:hypothetical protein B0H10DRAFT_1376178 [Mycena sp. CBHHK59/15]